MNILPSPLSLSVPVSSMVTPKWERQKVVNNIGTIIIGWATHEHDFSAIYPKLAESSNEFHLRGYMWSGDYSHGLRGCVEIERLVRRHQELHRGSHRLATHARLTLLRFMYLSNALWRLKTIAESKRVHARCSRAHGYAVITGYGRTGLH